MNRVLCASTDNSDLCRCATTPYDLGPGVKHRGDRGAGRGVTKGNEGRDYGKDGDDVVRK